MQVIVCTQIRVLIGHRDPSGDEKDSQYTCVSLASSQTCRGQANSPEVISPATMQPLKSSRVETKERALRSVTTKKFLPDKYGQNLSAAHT